MTIWSQQRWRLHFYSRLHDPSHARQRKETRTGKVLSTLLGFCDCGAAFTQQTSHALPYVHPKRPSETNDKPSQSVSTASVSQQRVCYFSVQCGAVSYDRQIAEVSNAGGISGIHAANPMATGHRLQLRLLKAQSCENHAGLTAVPSVPRAAPPPGHKANEGPINQVRLGLRW